ncbi:hypothetical protein JQ608_34850 [Bradyrhizobium liaoningense]|uniref:hypothetical protein n=1 Tax=Bradyrhizobium liaoningense TaxID=43992 RepID=UPI001BAA4B47|nr:hypothetical protein [Bradyrhizobium liaoningense]MBR0882234.1 hypothetical protein [Bradyrhizobium liaoningense]
MRPYRRALSAFARMYRDVAALGGGYFPFAFSEPGGRLWSRTNFNRPIVYPNAGLA